MHEMVLFEVYKMLSFHRSAASHRHISFANYKLCRYKNYICKYIVFASATVKPNKLKLRIPNIQPHH